MASNLGLPYVSPFDKEYAAKTQANVARAQWEDYKRRFEPYEGKLLSMLNDKDGLNTALAGANDTVQQQLQGAQQGLGMNLAKYGVAQGATERASSQRELGLNAAKDTAGLRNAIRTHSYDRDMNLMTGASNTIGGMKVEDK